MDELWDDYLQYLIWRGGLQRYVKYGRLFEIMHDINFNCILERDDNRYDDGVELRDEYTIPDDYYDFINEFMNRPCSVLEMLLGLAIRVDDEFIGDPAEEHPEIFFMEMIKNLGLDRFKGDRYRDVDVVKIVLRWINREFEKDGRGSPFPIKYDCRDQRYLEIWDQMNVYISENYD